MYVFLSSIACDEFLLFGFHPRLAFNGVYRKSDTLVTNGYAVWVKKADPDTQAFYLYYYGYNTWDITIHPCKILSN